MNIPDTTRTIYISFDETSSDDCVSRVKRLGRRMQPASAGYLIILRLFVLHDLHCVAITNGDSVWVSVWNTQEGGGPLHWATDHDD